MSPNLIIHNKWCLKAGIDELVATIVNRFIDYGSHYGVYDKKDKIYFNENERIIERQLKYFYRMDQEKKFSNENLYVKAYYLHHLLDFFMETRINVLNIELVLKKFLEEKVVSAFTDEKGDLIKFQKELNEIFQLLRNNKQELYIDLKGKYLTNNEMENKKVT